jgi:hypothetical protein
VPATGAGVAVGVTGRGVPSYGWFNPVRATTDVPLVTANVLVTGVAAGTEPAPAWVAVRLQVPTPVAVTVAPVTLQAPAAVNVTGSPELAVADAGKGAVP